MIEGPKTPLNEASIKYQARTKLASLGTEIAGARKLSTASDKLLQATKIRILLKALDYSDYMTQVERERIWYALIQISEIYDFPTAPLLEQFDQPAILQGYAITNTYNVTGLDTLTNGYIYVGNASNEPVGVPLTGDIGITNTGVSSIQAGVIVNADINASAAIAMSKLAALTASRAVVTNGSGVLTTSAVTATEISYLSGVTSNLQTQINALGGGGLSPTLTSAYIFVGNGSNVATGVAVTGDIGITNAGVVSITAGAIVNADINASAAIAYSKLNLTGSIVNADINASAAIAYSKLNLTGAILNADINASAAIALSKLASLTASRAVVTNGSGVITVSSTTSAEIGYVAGVTSAIQTQLDAKLAKITQFNRQTASYQLVLGDAYKVVEMNVGSANDLTVPANATVAFDIGTSIHVTQYGSGTTTIVAGGGVTLRSANGLILDGQYAGATLLKVGTDEWYVFGRTTI